MITHRSAGKFLLVSGITSLFAFGSAYAADSACHHTAEEKSVYVRSLQTGLMVSALTCNDSDQYNEFIHRFQSVLTHDAKELQGFYNHRSGGSEELNSFVTHLANDESQRSLQMGQVDYCTNAASVFKQVLALQPEQLDEFATTQPIIVDAPVHPCAQSTTPVSTPATGDIMITPTPRNQE